MNQEEIEKSIETNLKPLFEPLPEGLSDEAAVIVRKHLDSLCQAVSAKTVYAVVKANESFWRKICLWPGISQTQPTSSR